jgi:hypothetical protein
MIKTFFACAFISIFTLNTSNAQRGNCRLIQRIVSYSASGNAFRSNTRDSFRIVDSSGFFSNECDGWYGKSFFCFEGKQPSDEDEFGKRNIFKGRIELIVERIDNRKLLLGFNNYRKSEVLSFYCKKRWFGGYKIVKMKKYAL